MLDRQLLFFPSREITQTPADVGLHFEDVSFSTSDGTRLHGWLVPGQGDNTLVWFHGNAGNISNRVDNIQLLNRRLGVNVFIFDYRGYGRSEGKPSERGMYLDGDAALEYLRSRDDVDMEKLILFGRSLGCAVAVELATRHTAKAVLLESPFTSVADMSRRTHPLLSLLLPPRLLVQSRFDSLSKIGRIESPVMVLHGDRDDIVPIEMGKELFDAANEPKRFYAIQGAGHNDTHHCGRRAILRRAARVYRRPASSSVDEVQSRIYCLTLPTGIYVSPTDRPLATMRPYHQNGAQTCLY